ncbi:calcium-binding protein [Halovulum sp. GXIMD14793]
MGYRFESGFTVFDDDTLQLQGISDVELFEIAGVRYMAAASEADSAVTVFRLDAETEPVVVSTISYSQNSGTQVATDLTFIDGPNGPQLLVLGRYDDNFGLYDLGSDGTATLSGALSDGTGLYARGMNSIVTTIGSRTIMYTASQDDRGVELFELTAGAPPTYIRNFSGYYGEFDYRLYSVSAMSHFRLHDTDYLAVANMHVDRVALFFTRWDGRLRIQDVFGDDQQGGISAVTALDGVQIETRGFLLVANSMADSISVLRVSVHGRFNLVDTFYDTRDTRFGGVTAMEVVEHNGRTFVFVGGADDGITLLELDYRGQLHHLATIADDFPTALQNVSSIAVEMIGDIAHVYVGSQTDHGITELTIDLSRSGQDIRGGRGNDTLTGTDGDDIIWGMGHKDTLYGGDGDDRLIDGRGKDVMYGGAGADIFEFVEDGRSDFIGDFEIGVDKIDLSDWDNLYHVSSLRIETRAAGAVIFVGDDIIRITSADGQPIDAALFTQDDFIFG